MKKLVALVLSSIMLLTPVVCHAEDFESNGKEEITSELQSIGIAEDVDASFFEALAEGTEISANSIDAFEASNITADPNGANPEESEVGLHVVYSTWTFKRTVYSWFTSKTTIKYLGVIYQCGYAYQGKPVKSPALIYDITSYINAGGSISNVSDITRGMLMKAGKDYSLGAKNATNASGMNETTFHKIASAGQLSNDQIKQCANLVVAGKGNYKGMKLDKNPYIISPMNFADDRILAVDVTVPYKNGKQQMKKPVIYLRSVKLKPNDYTVEFVGNGSGAAGIPFGDVGSYTIKLSPGKSGNIVGTTTVKEIVTDKIPASKIKLTYTKKFTYTGAANTPAVTATYKKLPLTPGKDYSIRYFNNVEKGTGYIVITGAGQFAGTAVKTFKIK